METGYSKHFYNPISTIISYMLLTIYNKAYSRFIIAWIFRKKDITRFGERVPLPKLTYPRFIK